MKMVAGEYKCLFFVFLTVEKNELQYTSRWQQYCFRTLFFCNVNDFINPFIFKIKSTRLICVWGMYLYLISQHIVVNRTSSPEIRRSGVLSEFWAYKLFVVCTWANSNLNLIFSPYL